jgi:hypothetical protein
MVQEAAYGIARGVVEVRELFIPVEKLSSAVHDFSYLAGTAPFRL